MRTRTDYIIVHCSATRPSQDIGFEEINKWHRQRGWNGCGYHFIIRRNGIIEDGRPTDAVGSHCRGRNHNSVGICMVGGVSQDDHTVAENNFEPDQWTALKTLVYELHEKYPDAKVRGHNDFNEDKECPSFDVKDWELSECDWIEGILVPGDEGYVEPGE